jgi:hypothetical protein
MPEAEVNMFFETEGDGKKVRNFSQGSKKNYSNRIMFNSYI